MQIFIVSHFITIRHYDAPAVCTFNVTKRA